MGQLSVLHCCCGVRSPQPLGGIHWAVLSVLTTPVGSLFQPVGLLVSGHPEVERLELALLALLLCTAVQAGSGPPS